MIKEGITGFSWETLKDLNLRIKHFKSEVLTDGAYILLEIIEQETSNNYLQICLKKRNNNEKIKILVNCQYGYSCCVEFESEWMNLVFIDINEDLKRRINQVFPYLNPEYLNRRIDSNDLNVLSDQEKKQINYWNSKTKGEVIFNGYD